eukprot:10318936-Lingulodinium_polyedra.AAC.1
MHDRPIVASGGVPARQDFEWAAGELGAEEVQEVARPLLRVGDGPTGRVGERLGTAGHGRGQLLGDGVQGGGVAALGGLSCGSPQ